jgi:rod shape determining protein RodA
VAASCCWCWCSCSGRSIRGSTRWIPIGTFSLQPSELMKVALIVALAKFLHDDTKTDGRALKDLIIPGMILAVPMGLILAQPDLGTALMCAFIFGTIMVLTQLKLRSLFTLAALFAAAAPLAYNYALRGYQKERITAFLALWSGEQDIQDAGWHTHQSLVSIGSGGVFGKGYMQGTQNQFGFLPDRHSDFPFAVWAEEQGLLGTTLLVGLYLFLVLWGCASPRRPRTASAPCAPWACRRSSSGSRSSTWGWCPACCPWWASRCRSSATAARRCSRCPSASGC